MALSFSLSSVKLCLINHFTGSPPQGINIMKNERGFCCAHQQKLKHTVDMMTSYSDGRRERSATLLDHILYVVRIHSVHYSLDKCLGRDFKVGVPRPSIILSDGAMKIKVGSNIMK